MLFPYNIRQKTLNDFVCAIYILPRFFNVSRYVLVNEVNRLGIKGQYET